MKKRSDTPIVILAAGKSSRLGEVSQFIKKYYLPISDSETILSRLIDQACSYSSRVFIATHEDLPSNYYRGAIPFMIKSYSPKNTYTVKEVIKYLRIIDKGITHCILINGDTIIGNYNTSNEDVALMFELLDIKASDNGLLVGSKSDESWRVAIDGSRVISISTDYPIHYRRFPYAVLGVYKINLDYYDKNMTTDMEYFEDVYAQDYEKMNLVAIPSSLPFYEVDTFSDYIRILNKLGDGN